MRRILCSTNIRGALRSRQRGFLLNPFRFLGGGGGGGSASITIEDFKEGTIYSGSVFNSSTTHPGAQLGDAIVAYCAWIGTAVVGLQVTCSGESDLTLIGSTDGSNTFDPFTGGPNGSAGHWLYIPSLSSTASKTLGWTNSVSTSTSPNGYVLRSWLLRGVTALDGPPVGALGTGTTPTVNKTTSVSNAAILAIGRSDGGDMTAPGTGYTQRTDTNMYGYHGIEDIAAAGAAGTKVVDATFASGNWMMHALALK